MAARSATSADAAKVTKQGASLQQHCVLNPHAPPGKEPKFQLTYYGGYPLFFAACRTNQYGPPERSAAVRHAWLQPAQLQAITTCCCTAALTRLLLDQDPDKTRFKLLLDKDPWVLGMQDHKGNNLLHVLAVNGNAPMARHSNHRILEDKDKVKVMPERPALFDMRNEDRLTPLGLAAYLNRREVFDVYLQYSIRNLTQFGSKQVDLIPLEGFDSLATMVAKQKGHPSVLQILADRGQRDLLALPYIRKMLEKKWECYASNSYHRSAYRAAGYTVLFFLFSILHHSPQFFGERISDVSSFLEHAVLSSAHIALGSPFGTTCNQNMWQGALALSFFVAGYFTYWETWLADSHTEADRWILIPFFIFRILAGLLCLNLCSTNDDPPMSLLNVLNLYGCISLIWEEGAIKLKHASIILHAVCIMMFSAVCYCYQEEPDCLIKKDQSNDVLNILLIAFFLHGNKRTGPYMVTIRLIFKKDVITFSIVYIFLMIGFAHSTVLLSPLHKITFNGYWKQVGSILQTTLGQVNRYDEFCGNDEFCANEDGWSKDYVRGLGILVFVICLVVLHLFLFNLLTSMLTKTYDEIMEIAENGFWLTRTRIILDMEVRFSRKMQEKCVLKYSSLCPDEYMHPDDNNVHPQQHVRWNEVHEVGGDLEVQVPGSRIMNCESNQRFSGDALISRSTSPAVYDMKTHITDMTIQMRSLTLSDKKIDGTKTHMKELVEKAKAILQSHADLKVKCVEELKQGNTNLLKEIERIEKEIKKSETSNTINNQQQQTDSVSNNQIMDQSSSES
eukprot:gene12355-2254_t